MRLVQSYIYIYIYIYIFPATLTLRDSVHLPKIVLRASLELGAVFTEAKKNFFDSFTVQEQAGLTGCSST
jgi:hypothetical protein